MCSYVPCTSTIWKGHCVWQTNQVLWALKLYSKTSDAKNKYTLSGFMISNVDGFIDPTYSPLQNLFAFSLCWLIDTIELFSAEGLTSSLLQMPFCTFLWFRTFKPPQCMFDLFSPLRRHNNADEFLQMPVKNIPYRKVASCPREIDFFVHPYPWGYRQNTEIS